MIFHIYRKSVMPMNTLIETANSLLWGRFTVALILCCGIYHTVKSGFIQLKLPKHLPLPRRLRSRRAPPSKHANKEGPRPCVGGLLCHFVMYPALRTGAHRRSGCRSNRWSGTTRTRSNRCCWRRTRG